MSSNQSKRIPDFSPFSAWYHSGEPAHEADDCASCDWRTALQDLVIRGWAERRPLSQDRLQLAIYDVAKGNEALGLRVEGLVNDVVTTALEFASLFGFALARTWPAGFEELDGWPAAAWILAGFDGGSVDVPIEA